MDSRPEGVPEGYIELACANPSCPRTAWVPDLRAMSEVEIVPVCSAECAVAVMDAMEDVSTGRQHVNTPECWCDPVVQGIAMEDGRMNWSLLHQ